LVTPVVFTVNVVAADPSLTRVAVELLREQVTPPDPIQDRPTAPANPLYEFRLMTSVPTFGVAPVGDTFKIVVAGTSEKSLSGFAITTSAAEAL
jgi:hypothetical protein